MQNQNTTYGDFYYNGLPIQENFEYQQYTCTGEYLFGFNGQEKDNEISGEGNAYTAMFWEYNPRLGRRWNLDPKPQINISDYACFGNDPIWFGDPLGDEFITKADKKKADKIDKTATNRIALLKEKLKSSSLTETQRNNYQSSIDNLNGVKNEIQEMRNSKTGFTFKKDIGGSFGGGKTRMGNDGVITLHYTNFFSMVHETHHGFQALKGDLTFSMGGKSGFAYDITDETSACQREYAFGDRGTFQNYSAITGDNVRNLVNPITGEKDYHNLPIAPINYQTMVYEYNKALPHDGGRTQLSPSTGYLLEHMPQYIAKDLMNRPFVGIALPYK